MQSISGFTQELWTVSGRILQGSCREFREGSGKVPHRKVGLKVTERLRKLRESSGKGADALGRAPGRFCRGSGQDGGVSCPVRDLLGPRSSIQKNCEMSPTRFPTYCSRCIPNLYGP